MESQRQQYFLDEEEKQRRRDLGLREIMEAAECATENISRILKENSENNPDQFQKILPLAVGFQHWPHTQQSSSSSEHTHSVSPFATNRVVVQPEENDEDDDVICLDPPLGPIDPQRWPNVWMNPPDEIDIEPIEFLSQTPTSTADTLTEYSPVESPAQQIGQAANYTNQVGSSSYCPCYSQQSVQPQSRSNKSQLWKNPAVCKMIEVYVKWSIEFPNLTMRGGFQHFFEKVETMAKELKLEESFNRGALCYHVKKTKKLLLKQQRKQENGLERRSKQQSGVQLDVQRTTLTQTERENPREQQQNTTEMQHEKEVMQQQQQSWNFETRSNHIVGAVDVLKEIDGQQLSILSKKDKKSKTVYSRERSNEQNEEGMDNECSIVAIEQVADHCEQQQQLGTPNKEQQMAETEKDTRKEDDTIDQMRILTEINANDAFDQIFVQNDFDETARSYIDNLTDEFLREQQGLYASGLQTAVRSRPFERRNCTNIGWKRKFIRMNCHDKPSIQLNGPFIQTICSNTVLINHSIIEQCQSHEIKKPDDDADSEPELIFEIKPEPRSEFDELCGEDDGLDIGKEKELEPNEEIEEKPKEAEEKKEQRTYGPVLLYPKMPKVMVRVERINLKKLTHKNIKKLMDTVENKDKPSSNSRSQLNSKITRLEKVPKKRKRISISPEPAPSRTTRRKPCDLSVIEECRNVLPPKMAERLNLHGLPICIICQKEFSRSHYPMHMLIEHQLFVGASKGVLEHLNSLSEDKFSEIGWRCEICQYQDFIDIKTYMKHCDSENHKSRLGGKETNKKYLLKEWWTAKEKNE